MKKIYNYPFIAVLLLFIFGITACNNEEFLSVDKYDVINGDQMFKSESDAEAGLDGCYDLMYPDKNSLGGVYGDNYGFKPQIMTGCHPTLETQATGWDKDFNTQSWTADNGDLSDGWTITYRSISRLNEYLEGLDEASTDVISEDAKKILGAQAKALRAYFYIYLSETWGRVPMLMTGETVTNTPNKARAETDEEAWGLIIDDLTYASENLDWAPENGEYGRATKGMALSYLAEAYMWKAYKTGESSYYSDAESYLKQVIESGTYELNPSFTTLWDPGAVWTKESVWQIVLADISQKASWSPDEDCAIFCIYNCACPDLGGWGSLYLSWEWYKCFEDGDRRRDASASPASLIEDGDTIWSENPYLKQTIPVYYPKYNSGGEWAPSIWSLKWWRTARADYQIVMAPMQIYFKRYANVLLDYAECRFRNYGADDAEAWSYVAQIRNRAFGNLEVGKSASLSSTYLPYYQSLMSDYYDETMEEYPIPFQETTVEVPDAKTYYTQVKSDYSLESEVWKVAVNFERRKEFNAEYCEKVDMQRSGFIADLIEHCYPQGVGVSNDDESAEYNWHTYRDFDHDDRKMLFPIPQDEILRNELISTDDQNPGY